MARRWHRHPLVRRLPIVIVVLAGLWLFKDRGVDRELVWRLPKERGNVERVEVQLRDPQGVLVQRSEFFFGPAQPAEEISLRLRLEEARYESEVRATSRDGSARTWRVPVEVRGDVVVVPLGAR